VGTVAPGINTATVTGLASGERTSFRLFTGGIFTPGGGSTFAMHSPENAPSPSGGSVSISTQNVTVTPSRETVMEGEISVCNVIKPGFLGFRSQNDITYLKAVVKTVASWTGDEFTCTKTIDPATNLVTTTGRWREYDFDRIIFYASVLDDDRTETEGEAAIFIDDEFHGGDYQCFCTLSELYDSATFKADAVKKIPPFKGNFQKYENWASVYYKTDEDGPWTGTGYIIHKLQYRWQVAKDPSMVVRWFVVFEPEDEDSFEIEGREWASMGQTESPPFVIDPVNYPSLNPDHKNGDYFIFSPKLAVDANRDGTIDPGTDQTSAQKPYRFWCNDDDDSNEQDHPGSNAKDSDSNTIVSMRDLEDFARLHIYIDSMHDAIVSGTISVGLEWRNVTSGSPSIKVFAAAENDGGDQYLKTVLGAGNQATGNAATALGNVTNGGVFQFPVSFWQADAMSGRPVISDDQRNRYLLFEGCSEGKGQLVLTYWKNGRKIGECGSVWIDLKNIKKMYERAISTPDTVIRPYNSSNSTIDDLGFHYTIDSSNAYQAPVDEQKTALVFVHGWNMSYNDYVNYSETMFKRLWRQGYKGFCGGVKFLL
ncbi:MAG: hypothetical protein WCH43_06205, partial [Verrucomicrobiota bacterium]